MIHLLPLPALASGSDAAMHACIRAVQGTCATGAGGAPISLTMRVVDQCGTCGVSDINLHRDAFANLSTTPSYGRMAVRYARVPCPFTGKGGAKPRLSRGASMHALKEAGQPL